MKFSREFSVAHEAWITICTQPFHGKEIQVLARFVFLVVLVPLIVPKWSSQKQRSLSDLCFRLPRGTLLVMRTTTMVQLTQASSVLAL